MTRSLALSAPLLIAAIVAFCVWLLAATGHPPTMEKVDGRITRYQELHGDAHGTAWETAGDLLIQFVGGVRETLMPSTGWMAFDILAYAGGGWLLLGGTWTYALWPKRRVRPIRYFALGAAYAAALGLGAAVWMSTADPATTYFWMCCDALIHAANLLGWSYIKTNVVAFLIALPGLAATGALIGLYRGPFRRS
jgi:hypothetical protein